MLQAQNDKAVQERLITKFMELPNNAWDKTIQDVARNINVLRDTEVVKTIVNVIKTNISVMSETLNIKLNFLLHFFLLSLIIKRHVSRSATRSASSSGVSIWTSSTCTRPFPRSSALKSYRAAQKSSSTAFPSISAASKRRRSSCSTRSSRAARIKRWLPRYRFVYFHFLILV